MTTPKTAFSGTAISVIVIVRKNACWAGGVVTASQAAAKPFSNAR